jgi:hypothetical protein
MGARGPDRGWLGEGRVLSKLSTSVQLPPEPEKPRNLGRIRVLSILSKLARGPLRSSA